MKNKMDYLQEFDRWLTLKNYSMATRKLYTKSVLALWNWSEKQAKNNPLFDKSRAVFLYLSERMKTMQYSTVNAEYSGIKLFYVSILGREWNMEKLPRPRKEKRLPVILSKQEVEELITNAGNFRNQVLLTLVYATGLRLGEVQRLRILDINAKSMQIHVHNGKGAKDRILPLPPDLLPLLEEYATQYKPKEYLFNGEVSGGMLSKRAIQHIVEQARVVAGIRRRASIHTLRHCFATHFYQHGSNGIALQLMLGHKNFKTTTQYIHLSGDYYRHLPNPATDLCRQLNTQSPPSSKKI